MSRRTQVLGFSVPPEIARECARLARHERTSKSELFRRMVEAYRIQLEREELLALQSRMARRAQARRVFTERDVERIVFADR
jgi:hypothetical protein